MVPYETLLAEADIVHTDQIQDMLHWSNHPFDRASDTKEVAVTCQAAVCISSGALQNQEVTVVSNSHGSFGGVSINALLLPQLKQAVTPAESPDVEIFTQEHLMRAQPDDNVTSRALFFVERGDDLEEEYLHISLLWCFAFS